MSAVAVGVLVLVVLAGLVWAGLASRPPRAVRRRRAMEARLTAARREAGAIRAEIGRLEREGPPPQAWEALDALYGYERRALDAVEKAEAALAEHDQKERERRVRELEGSS